MRGSIGSRRHDGLLALPLRWARHYEELYSDLRGEVVARPMGEPHAGVNRQELADSGFPTAAPSYTDAPEFVPPPAGAGHDGGETNRSDDDSLPWPNQAEVEEPLWSTTAELAAAKLERHPSSERPTSRQPGQWLE